VIDLARLKPINYQQPWIPVHDEDGSMIRKFLLAVLLLAPLGFYPLLHSKPEIGENDKPNPPSQQASLTEDERSALASLSILPIQSFPGAFPWVAMHEVAEGKTRKLDELAEKDPVAFLEQALKKVDKEVHGYRCMFDKQERVKGALRKPESILVHFRKEPFSVHMNWKKGDTGFLAPARTLFVKGEGDVDVIHVRVRLGGEFVKKLDDKQVTATSRFGIDKFGMHFGARDTLEHMKTAKEKNALFLRYDGKERVKEVGDRLCYKFVRWKYEKRDAQEEADKLNELTTYVDAVTLLQVGSILKDTEGNLIAYYFFRDIWINPTFDEKQFTPEGL
jgi:hypothetical protein